ncbi:MAG: hypothetical protein IPK03_03265 [Bacteroidetes bacterium]|nr:hypothetical protein [Bacteroidota bacterium]
MNSTLGEVLLMLKNIQIKLKNYLTEEFPTTTFIGGLNRNSGIAETIPGYDSIIHIHTLDNNIEILDLNFPKYVRESEIEAPEEIPMEVFIEELNLVQRVLRINTDFDTAKVLLTENLHSSSIIFEKGETNIRDILESYEIPEEQIVKQFLMQK